MFISYILKFSRSYMGDGLYKFTLSLRLSENKIISIHRTEKNAS